MNKGAIQRFAIWARTELIAQVSQRAYQYGITKDGYGEQNAVTVGGRALTTDEQRQRKELVEQIRSKGYTQVMEEVAYTWFNRFIALRFMEVNNYLPSHIRVFSDSTGAFKPEILNDVLHLDLPGLNTEKVADYIEKNQTEDLYRYLLLTQCNALNASLPQMFERMGGFTELLLPNNILKQDSILGHMVTDIPEEDWTDQVQIIGWLYQYYNSELKDETFALLKKNVKITKERIPSATQLFTPDWIVRYMVENSLGRLWIEGHPDDELKSGWKYYLDEAEQEPEVQAQIDKIHAEYATLKPQDIKVIDPCMGSGHILVYAFDVLIQIYKKYGVSERDAAQSILQNNLYGLDIDDRAAQLAYFAVMMKARQYDRRIFSRDIQPHVYAIVESNDIDTYTRDYFTNNDPKLKTALDSIIHDLRDAKEYGSILTVAPVDFAALYARMDEVQNDVSLYRESALNTILPLIRVAEVLAQKYDVVVTNPPYMGSSNMDARLNDFVKKHYPDSKSDLFAVFIERCGQMTGKNRYQAMITQHAWMFLSSFEKLRAKLLLKDTVNMAHLGPRAFEEIGGEVVQTTSFVLRNSHIADYKGAYCRLIEPTTQQGKEEMFLSGENRYTAPQSNFSKIPGSPVAYWVSKNIEEDFQIGILLSKVASPKQGMATADNARFVRKWYEPNISKIALNGFNGVKWFPYNNGGGYRRWYGFNTDVVNWEDNGSEIKSFPKAYVRNEKDYFKSGITWNAITSSDISVRYFGEGYIFSNAGMAIFATQEKLLFILAFINSLVAKKILSAISPTLNYNAGDIANLPLLLKQDYMNKINRKTQECIDLSTSDWDSYETSWDFKGHPLVLGRLPEPVWGDVPDRVAFQNTSISYTYQMYWKKACEYRFEKLKANEEELNRIFIDIYGLQDELPPDVADKDVTVHRIFDTKDDVPESMQGSNYVRTKRDEIVSLISYAVGCMFGRYSLDVDGLAYAGGDWDTSKYRTIIPDKDNIIPICDDDYFDDDITGRFVKWVETVYGSDTLEENLKFIADAIGGKGTPREVIRSYFLNDFYADHCKTYQKRPIYWLFDSGKKNGFKALIYMHRYQSDLLARMRTDYVHEQQERYRTQLAHLADAIDHASASERVKLTKQQKKIQEQSLEIQKYEEKVHHLADQNIQIDLDDGVKHNYELFADVLAKIK